MKKNRIVRTEAGSEKYGVPIGQPIPRKDQLGRPITTLIGGQTLVNVHPPDKCAGEFCTIHNPSDHHMKDWPQNWRQDRGIMERLCECGIGHPDLDDPTIIKFKYESIHGCCGHCAYDLKIEGLPARYIQEGYAARSDGTIWSFWKKQGPKHGNICIVGRQPNQLVGRPNEKGYLRVSINGDSYIHRLMWKTWKGEIPDGQQIRHLDGDNSHNGIWNLALGTQVDNEADKERHGRVPRGSLHKNSKLSEENVLTARMMWATGSSLSEIISQLNLSITKSTLHEAITRKTWKQVKE